MKTIILIVPIMAMLAGCAKEEAAQQSGKTQMIEDTANGAQEASKKKQPPSKGDDYLHSHSGNPHLPFRLI